MPTRIPQTSSKTGYEMGVPKFGYVLSRVRFCRGTTRPTSLLAGGGGSFLFLIVCQCNVIQYEFVNKSLKYKAFIHVATEQLKAGPICQCHWTDRNCYNFGPGTETIRMLPTKAMVTILLLNVRKNAYIFNYHNTSLIYTSRNWKMKLMNRTDVIS